MKKNYIILGFVTLALMSPQLAFSDSPDYVDYRCAKKSFGEIDINKNDTVSLKEFTKAGFANTLFTKININKDDAISRGEFFYAMEEGVLTLEKCPNVKEFRLPN